MLHRPAYVQHMEVSLPPEQTALLAKLATATGKQPEQVASDLLIRTLTEDAKFLEAVEVGFAQLDRGEFVTQEEVGQRLERIFRS